jgi:hypothetical protein
LLFRSLLLFRCLARQRPTHLLNLPLAIIWEDAGSNVSGTGVEQIAERHHDGRDNGLGTFFRSTTESCLVLGSRATVDADAECWNALHRPKNSPFGQTGRFLPDG